MTECPNLEAVSEISGLYGIGVIGVTMRAKTGEQLTECGIYHVGTLFMLLIRYRRLWVLLG